MSNDEQQRNSNRGANSAPNPGRGRSGRGRNRWRGRNQRQRQGNSVSSTNVGGDTLPALQDIRLNETESSLSSLTYAAAASASPSFSTPRKVQSASTSFSTPRKVQSASTSFSPTREVQKEWEKEWADFSKSVDMTPPRQITRSLAATESFANECLKLAGVKGNWGSLSAKQKGMIAFVINEDLVNCFPGTREEAAKKIVKAVFGIGERDAEIWHSNLENFVKKGGDKIFRKKQEAEEGGDVSKYEKFVEKCPIWKDLDERSTTIPKLKPVLRFQNENSMACSIVTAAIVVDYSHKCRSHSGGDSNSATVVTSDNNGGGEEIEATLMHFSMNVARLMRQELSREEMYAYIFKSIGFRVSDILTRIMVACNPGSNSEDVHDSISFDLYLGLQDGNDAALDRCYQDLQLTLASGPLFTDRFRLYDEYGSSDTCVSSGTKTYNNNKFHTITMIGVARTPQKNGGILFLVQDSDCKHTFKNIGLNLLLQMGIKFLGHLRAGLKFPRGGVFDLAPNQFAFIFSGGKSLIDDERRVTSAEEWKADGGPLERYFSYTDSNYVPSWKRRGGYEEP
jgi:hypothetical protein